jgi:hypothetical protein
MNGQNKLFMNNVAGYLANHSIIVPTCFTDNNGGRGLVSGNIYSFDLQTLAAGGTVNVQPGAAGNLVILAVMANRGAATGCWTRGINAMWLAGPPGVGVVANNLPVGINHVFTESLGGCSVYIQAGQIRHSFNGILPPGTLANQGVLPPYAGTAGNFDQTCAVAYCAAGVWSIATSVPHDVGPFHRVHAASGYRYMGY